MEKRIKGIAVCNPVDLDREYMLFTADYAVKRGINHYQIVGPIHNPEKGNLDGMTFYRKYAQFNNEKNEEYVRFCESAVNEVLEKLSKAGIKSYMWHHELEVPEGFKEAFPEIQNEYGDVEITHPVIKDFLENKIADFFAAYPKMDGIILTLHETRIPLLKLQNQKLSKIERVKYVTEILYNSCTALGKELIVRPFASVAEDYEMMTKAYEQISSDMVIMDKWTQFDWSLTLPENRFFSKIKNNPLLVETDIFGEYFGLGRLPIMLKKHIIKNFTYCEKFSPLGYMSRIDRATYHSFSDVNEVNYRIMEACLDGADVDEAIDSFFSERYKKAGPMVRELMENTEDIQRRIFYLNGYYFTEGSRFPRLNHSKNHFYFEMMKDEHYLESGEWFIPKNWERGSIETIREEKASAVADTEKALKLLGKLKDKLCDTDYEVLENKFCTLYHIALIWQNLTEIFINYSKYFETRDEKYSKALMDAAGALSKNHDDAYAVFKDDFYVNALKIDQLGASSSALPIPSFIEDLLKNFNLEKSATDRLESENLYDFVICGGATEGHKIKKEVNFSDTYIKKHGICRIPGTNRGKKFSSVNAHGWFSYEMKVRPHSLNTVVVAVEGTDSNIDFKITIDDCSLDVTQKAKGINEFEFDFEETEGYETVRIRFDRISPNTPYFYEIKIK